MSTIIANNETSLSARSRPALALHLCLAVLGIATLLFATAWGIGTSPDSASYIQDARLLSSKEGLWRAISTPGAISSQRPPLYAALLAIPGFFKFDPLATARGLHALIFGANLLLFGYLLRRHTAHWWLAPLGMLLLMFSEVLLTVHAYAWSEALFILLSFAGLYLFALFLNSGRRRLLLASSLLIALACLTRYAGLPLIAVVATILFLRRRTAKRPWRTDLVTVIGISGLPLLLWLARNWMIEGSGTSRALNLHLIGRQHLWEALFTVTGWLQLPPSTPGFIRLALFLMVLLAVVVVTRQHGKNDAIVRLAKGQPFALLLVMFVLFYGLFLAFSISFLDANTPLDDRILSPVFVASLLLMLMLSGRVMDARKRKATVAYTVAALVLLLASGVSTRQWVSFHHENGLGTTSRFWQESAVAQEVRKLPGTAIIYSNATEIVYFNADRPALALPRKSFAMSGQQNEGYENELDLVVQQVNRREAMIVYFDAFAQRPVTSEPELLARGLIAITQTEEGTIYGGLAE